MTMQRTEMPTQHGSPQTPLVIGVPGFDSFRSSNGIGRVLTSLCGCWNEDVQVLPAAFDASALPILRNNPTGILTAPGVDLIFLPQMSGAQALQRTSGVPSLVIVHDIGIVDFPGDRESMDWITWHSLRRSFLGLRHATRIVSVSRFTEERLIYHLPDVAERVTTIPDGVDGTFLGYRGTRMTARFTIERIIETRLGDPLLTYVGSELPRKNMETLLEAFQRVRQSRPGAQLLKIGDAGHTRWRSRTLEIAERIGIEVGKDLLLLQDVNDVTLAHAYRAADVFVSASLYEGFGLPALEAMATGTPVVVTTRGAFPEVVDDIGWVAEPDPDDLALAIIRAIDDPDRERRIQQGQLRAARLVWKRSADDYLALMRQVVRDNVAVRQPAF